MTAVIENTLGTEHALSFEQTIPRRLVHKHSLENVFLTELQPVGEDRFRCGARIPKAHRFFNESTRLPQADITFYTEVGRQASLACSHAFFAVGVDKVFIFERSQVEIPETCWRAADRLAGDWIVIEARIKEKETRKTGEVSRIVAEYSIYNERTLAFSGVFVWNMQPFALFERLRRRSARGPAAAVLCPQQPPMAPGRLGRELAENVVISTPERGENGNFTAALLVDLQHPFFFDHPCEHVPGMLLIEGCAQMAATATSQASGRDPREILLDGYQIEFTKFVECHSPVTLEARFNGPHRAPSGAPRGTVEIRISQDGVLSGTAVMSVAFAGARSQ